MQLTFTVEKQHIKRTDKELPVAKSRNYLTAKFAFVGDEWTGTKTAIFKNGSDVLCVVLSEDDTCLVPWEVIKSGIFMVSVFCGDLVTVNQASVKVDPTGYAEGDTPKQPTPDVYNQIIDLFNNLHPEVNPADIATAVSAYLTEHPIDTLTEDEVQTIVSEYVTTHKDELKGEPGEDGATFTPSVSEDGVLSWANDKGLDNPTPVNIKGNPGDPGTPGSKGTTFTPSVDASGNLSWTNDGGKENPATINIKGKDGASGIPSIVNQTSATVEIKPNVLNVWGEMASLTITLATPTDSTIVNEYMIQFTSGATATVLTLPNTLKWYQAPTIEANKTYQISIINGIGLVVGA